MKTESRDRLDGPKSAQIDKLERVKLTSIGELFQLEINVIKLCGGFMLDERFNWYFSVAYKAAITAATYYFAQNNFVVYNSIVVDAKSARQYIKFFWTLHRIATSFAFLNSGVSSVRNKRLISVLLSKRLDERYFIDPSTRREPADEAAPSPVASECGDASSIIVSPAWSESDETPQLACPEVALGKSQPVKRPTWLLFSRLRKEDVRVNLRRMRSDLEGGVRSTLGTTISRVRLSRFLAILFILMSALTATLRNINEHHHSASSALGAESRSLALAEVATSYPILKDAANLSNSTKTSVAANAAKGLSKLVQEGVVLMRTLAWAVEQLARFTPTFLEKLCLCIFLYSQLYGQVFITLFITGAISDALRLAAQAHCWRMENKPRAGPERCRKGPGEPALEDPALGAEMTQLLVQVREVLLALRSAMSLNYLFLQVVDMSIQMGFFSLFISFVSSKQVDWITLLVLDYFVLVLGSVSARVGYSWLHSEVRKLSSIKERRIISSALETRDLVEGPAPSSEGCRSANRSASATSSHLTSPALTSSRATSASRLSSNYQLVGLPNDQFEKKLGRAAAAERRQASYLTRIEATTNFRLAQEIEQIWPTDWFNPDLQSYVSQNFFVITFVATLQQLVEAGSKLQVQVQKSGGEVLTKNNSAPVYTLN